jgi:hypothetical protein
MCIERANSNDTLTFNEEGMAFKDLREAVTPFNHLLQQHHQKTIFSTRILNNSFWQWDIEQHKATDILTNDHCCFYEKIY